LLFEIDEILILAAIVARALYGVLVPVALLDSTGHTSVRTGDFVEIDDSHIKVTRG
jgi:predicted aconitase with swiveling domain